MRCSHRSPAVVLATGGFGQLYSHTTNPPENTGDGLALAARAGAHLADLEFVQFHPTAIDVGADPLPLATEALRGEGAVLVDETGRRFMKEIHPDAELAPRDVVSRVCSSLARLVTARSSTPATPSATPFPSASPRYGGTAGTTASIRASSRSP